MPHNREHAGPSATPSSGAPRRMVVEPDRPQPAAGRAGRLARRGCCGGGASTASSAARTGLAAAGRYWALWRDLDLGPRYRRLAWRVARRFKPAADSKWGGQSGRTALRAGVGAAARSAVVGGCPRAAPGRPAAGLWPESLWGGSAALGEARSGGLVSAARGLGLGRLRLEHFVESRHRAALGGAGQFGRCANIAAFGLRASGLGDLGHPPGKHRHAASTSACGMAQHAGRSGSLGEARIMGP